MKSFAAVLLAARLGSLTAAAAPNEARLERAKEGAPAVSIAADALKLPSIDRAAALVYFSPDRRAVAEESAGVQEKINRSIPKTLGIPSRIFGLVLVSGLKDLPAAARNASWLNVGDAACLIQTTSAAGLAKKGDEFHYVAFYMPAQQDASEAIKAALFGGRLTPDSASSRWWVEGVADYAAYQAVRENDHRAVAPLKHRYIQALNSVKSPVLDLGDAQTWWPNGPKTGAADVNHAYAAAHEVISSLSAKHGDSWIAATLQALKAENKGAKTTSDDFCRVASKITGEDVAGMIRAVKVDDVKKFAAAL